MRNRGDGVDGAVAAAAASARCCAFLIEDLEVQKKLRGEVTELEGVGLEGVAALVGGADIETSSPSNRRWMICGSAVI